MSQELRRVGFIGLGRMGTAMARNCLRTGFELSGYNRIAAKTKPLVDEGAAGDADGIARCRPLFRAYSQAAVRVAADHAVANSLKIAVSCMGASMLELMGEVYAFAKRSGIESRFIDLLTKTVFGRPGLGAYAERVRTRSFDDVGFELTGGLKDVELMLQASGDTRVAFPHAGIIRDKLLAAIAHGLRGKDWSASCEVARMNAGLE